MEKLNLHFDYQCDNGKFVAGIESTYDLHHKDRDFSIYCCGNSEVELTSCRKTPQYINNLDLRFDFSVEGNQIFTGFESMHHNYQE